MSGRMLHVYRNTPFGRETLMSSAYFAERCSLAMTIFVPREGQFLMYFPASIATVQLDASFLRSPTSAEAHVAEIMTEFDVDHSLFEPKLFTSEGLPSLPTSVDFMCCPRSISDLSSRIGLGHIGPRVRAIIRHARFPVLIPAPVAKRWECVMAFFGGSALGARAVTVALDVATRSGASLKLFTFAEDQPRSHFESRLEAEGLRDELEDVEWTFVDEGSLPDALFAVPHDALAVAGAYGHSLARDLVFGSHAEMLQTVLPNPLLIVGPSVKLSQP